MLQVKFEVFRNLIASNQHR